MPTNSDTVPKSATPADEVRLVDLATIVLRRRRLIAGITLSCLLIAGLVTLFQPTRYRAETVLVPAAEKGGGTRVGALISQVPGSLQALAGGAIADPKQQLIESILRSRALEVALVAELADPAGPTAAEVRRIVDKGIRVDGRMADGAITVQVTARNAALAARIANAFPPLVNEIATRLGAELAEQKQLLLRRQLEEAAEQLANSEMMLLGFQEQRDLPEIEEQARLTIGVAARLQQAIITKELEIVQLRRTATADNPTLRAALAELNSLQEQLSGLAAGRSGREDILIPLSSSPELKLEATRLFRDYQRDEQIYIALTAALADTQIEAQNSLPVVGVLDTAAVPTVPAPSYAGLILVLAMLLGLLLGLITAFTAEHLVRMQADSANEELLVAWGEFRETVRLPSPWARRSSRALPTTEIQDNIG